VQFGNRPSAGRKFGRRLPMNDLRVSLTTGGNDPTGTQR
jgi:hypothetical protein